MQDDQENSLVIRFITGAEIKHVNLRKQGNEDAPIKAVDIKLSGECSNTCLPRILGCNLEQITPAFWANDEVRNPLLTGVTEIKTWAEFEDCELEIDSRPFSQVKVKNIRFKPLSNLKVLLTLSASITGISNSELAVIANLLNEQTDCIIIGQPELALNANDSAKPKIKARHEQQPDLLESDSGMDVSADPVYLDAVSFVRKEKKASISQVQRHFHIGYNRAARLVEQMEYDGIVSVMKSNGQRELIG